MCFKAISDFLDIVTYMTPSFGGDSNLVVVLKNDCLPHLGIRRQFSVEDNFHNRLWD